MANFVMHSLLDTHNEISQMSGYLLLRSTNLGGNINFTGADTVTDTIGGTWSMGRYTLPLGTYVLSCSNVGTTDTPQFVSLQVLEDGNVLRTYESMQAVPRVHDVLIIDNAGVTIELYCRIGIADDVANNAELRLVKLS